MPIPAHDRIDLGDRDLSGYGGLSVVADAHGAFEAFDAALDAAARNRRFVVQLGDLIDRGPYSPLCVERMLDLEDEGGGVMLLGNHEVAFADFVEHGTGGAVTRQATLLQFEEHGGDLIDRYVRRIRNGPLWITWGRHLFVHAAFHPRMLDPGPADEDLARIAVHGYGTSRERRTGHLARTWVDAVPKGMTVVVGHAVTESRAIETVAGRQGGAAVFADTGFWIDDGTPVPVLDIPFQPPNCGTGCDLA